LSHLPCRSYSPSQLLTVAATHTVALTLSHPHSRTPTFALTLSHSHCRSYSLSQLLTVAATHTVALTLPHSDCRTNTVALSLSQILTVAATHTVALTLPHSDCRTNTVALSLSQLLTVAATHCRSYSPSQLLTQLHSHCHTPTVALTLSLSHFRSPTALPNCRSSSHLSKLMCEREQYFGVIVTHARPGLHPTSVLSVRGAAPTLHLRESHVWLQRGSHV
jgi:hypothetical protein